MIYAMVSLPTMEERLAEPAARVAWRFYRLAIGAAQAHIPSCYMCGGVGGRGWCNTCEVMGNRPLPDFPHIITPYCPECDEANVKCSVCGVHPRDGPQDDEFTPPGAGEPGAPVMMVMAGSQQVHTL